MDIGKKGLTDKLEQMYVSGKFDGEVVFNTIKLIYTLQKQNIELQKQVDELKKREYKLVERIPIDENGNFINYAVYDTDRVLSKAEYRDYVFKQAVKNIIISIKNSMRCFEDDDDGYLLKRCEFDFFMREIAKENGVEVE